MSYKYWSIYQQLLEIVIYLLEKRLYTSVYLLFKMTTITLDVHLDLSDLRKCNLMNCDVINMSYSIKKFADYVIYCVHLACGNQAG
jgi:hypothetical protein